MEKSNGYIQLPYGYVENENDKKIHLDLPHNFKKNLLFDKLPFLAQINNPAIDNVVKGKETDDLSIQKFLLATGLLEDTIQNNLDMIVTDGEFNNAGIRRVLDQKFPTIMDKPTAANFIFKDKAKFDIQNPVIASLYNQLLTEKQKEKLELEAIGKAPSIKDIDIKKKLDDLNKFNLGIKGKYDNDDDDDNNNNGSFTRPRNNFPRAPSPGPLTPPITPSSSSSIQRFLLGNNSGNERTATATGENTTSTPKTVSFLQTLTKVFPKTKRELIPLDSITEENEIQDFDISESSVVSTVDGQNSIDLEFFSGGENKQKLIENPTKNVGILNESNQKFIEYLSSNFGSYLLRKNKMKIHLECGKIFHNNNSTSESLYDFLKVQEDIKKKRIEYKYTKSN